MDLRLHTTESGKIPLTTSKTLHVTILAVREQLTRGNQEDAKGRKAWGAGVEEEESSEPRRNY